MEVGGSEWEWVGVGRVDGSGWEHGLEQPHQKIVKSLH